jgi:hypothetical protein
VLEGPTENIAQDGDAIMLRLEGLGAALREVLESRERVVRELKKSQSHANVAELALTLLEQGGCTIGKLTVEQAIAQGAQA